jgi:hypothetical protein
MRESYSYLADDRVTITRPQAVREIFAVKAFRTGQWSPQPALNPYIEELVRMDVNKMIKMGWIRSVEQFAAYKGDIRARNTRLMRRILTDV